MAPEIIQGKTYTEKADVYSFGIIVWELIAREDPYKGMPTFAVAHKVVHEGIRPEIPEAAPAGLAKLMQKCWATDPNDVYMNT